MTKKMRNDPTRGFVRSMNNLQMISAMSMSWFLMIAGFWTFQRLLHGTLLDNIEMAKVVNAAALTIVAVVTIIGMDMVADRFNAREVTKLENLAQGLAKTTGLSRVPDVVPDIPGVELDVADLADNLERVFRTVIDAYGLLVGLCWEKAADAAIEVIIEGNSLFRSHVVISKVVFAFAMMVYMYHAWKKYIVPSAEKSAQEHKLDIELERAMRRDPDLVKKVCEELLSHNESSASRLSIQLPPAE
jgi:hypothetical protein